MTGESNYTGVIIACDTGSLFAEADHFLQPKVIRPVSGRIGDPIELGTPRPQLYVELGTLA